MVTALIAAAVTVDLALLGALFKLGIMIGKIESTVSNLAADQTGLQDDLKRHLRGPHPERWPAQNRAR